MASSSYSSSEINNELIDNGKLTTPTLSSEKIIEMGNLTASEITNEMGKPYIATYLSFSIIKSY